MQALQRQIFSGSARPSRWLRFEGWHLDPRSLALFRILLGITLLADLLVNKWAHWQAFYSDGPEGMLSWELVLGDRPPGMAVTSLLYWIPGDGMVHAVMGLTTLALAALVAGWHSRLAGLVALVGLWSIHLRNPIILSGPDEYLMVLLFWSLFLPLDGHLALRKRRAAVPQAAAAAFLIQVALIYFFNAWLKSGPLWQEGDALAYALMEDYWRHDTAQWLLAWPALCSWLTHATVYIEYGIALLVLLPWGASRWRVLVVILLCLLHGTIAIFLNLGLFPLIILSLMAALMPGQVWSRLGWKADEDLPQPHGESSWRRRALQWSVVLCLLPVLWKASLRLRELPASDYSALAQALDQTTLWSQNWAFYAPEPTRAPACFRIKVITADGSASDAASGAPWVDSPDGYEAYVSYSWGVFFYKSQVYRFYPAVELKQAWAAYAHRQISAEKGWEKGSFSVEIWAFRRRIRSATDPGQVLGARIAAYPPVLPAPGSQMNVAPLAR